MKSMKNIAVALGALLLVAGAYYLYQKRHVAQDTVKIQIGSSLSNNLQSATAPQKAATAKLLKSQSSQIDKMVSNPSR